MTAANNNGKIFLKAPREISEEFADLFLCCLFTFLYPVVLSQNAWSLVMRRECCRLRFFEIYNPKRFYYKLFVIQQNSYLKSRYQSRKFKFKIALFYIHNLLKQFPRITYEKFEDLF